MKTLVHVSTSAMLSGTVYAATYSPDIAIACFLSGILLDLDHLLDYFLLAREQYSLKNFRSWCDDARWERIILLLHSYEIYFVLCVITFHFQHELLIGLMLGTGLHLMLDELGNRFSQRDYMLSPWFYFLVYRISVGFHNEKLRREK